MTDADQEYYQFIPSSNYWEDEPHKFFLSESRKKENPLIWGTLGLSSHNFYPTDIIRRWRVPFQMSLLAYPILKDTTTKTDFERMIEKLEQTGSITPEYAKDMMHQEKIFRDNFNKMPKEVTNKEVLVCGNEIFVGDSFEELFEKARNKYPNRPFYSYSSTREPI